MRRKALWTTLPGAKVTPPKVRRRIRQKSKRQGQRVQRYLKIRKDFLKEHPVCAVCLDMSNVVAVIKIANYRVELATQVHHRKGRIGELMFDTRFFMAVCAEHHQQITNHPTWAKTNGYIVDRYGI